MLFSMTFTVDCPDVQRNARPSHYKNSQQDDRSLCDLETKNSHSSSRIHRISLVSHR